MVDKNPHRTQRRRDPDATRQALLEVGTELFAERGYDGVPLSAIAERAGVNKAMVSYHFGGKRKLYLAIVNATLGEIVERAEKLAESPSPAPLVLRELIHFIGDMAVRGNPHFPAMMLREALAGGKRLERETMAHPLRVAEAVRRIVERGIREGAFRRVDPWLTHVSVVGSLLFFFATARMRERLFTAGHLPGRLPEATDYVKHVQELVTQGLARRNADDHTREG